MQTILYESLERRFQSVAGLATLDQTDKFFFHQSLNSRLREAWDRIDWPELIEVKELALTSTDEGEKVASLDQDVLEVWDKHPFRDRNALKIGYNLIDSKVILAPGQLTFEDKIYALCKKEFGARRPVKYSVNTEPGGWYIQREHDGVITHSALNFDDALMLAEQMNEEGQTYADDYDRGDKIPKFLENYSTASVFSDFLRGDGQHDASSREESKAEEHLLRQIDRVEKLQQQNSPTITQYGVNTPHTLVFQ